MMMVPGLALKTCDKVRELEFENCDNAFFSDYTALQIVSTAFYDRRSQCRAKVSVRRRCHGVAGGEYAHG